MDLLSTLSKERLTALAGLMHHARLTAVLEVLQPGYQHVVDLSYLGDKSELTGN